MVYFCTAVMPANVNKSVQRIVFSFCEHLNLASSIKKSWLLPLTLNLLASPFSVGTIGPIRGKKTGFDTLSVMTTDKHPLENIQHVIVSLEQAVCLGAPVT